MKKSRLEKYMDKNDDSSETRIIEQLTDEEHISDHNTKSAADEEESLSAKREVFSFFRSMIIFMLAFVIVTNFIVLPIQVQGSSMYPTLEDQSSGLSNLLGKETESIKRFDIVIIKIGNKRIVKRVIGLPGETISYQNGMLYVNGEHVTENFLDKSYVEGYEGNFMANVTPITLGTDEYYCLGDNRPHSSDSRYYGAFKAEDITSKGIFIVFPFDQFGVKSW